jgi:hypothetical protein
VKRIPSKPLADVFKPRLPRDPFVETHQPWALKIDDVISATNAHSRRDVLLVLGGMLAPIFNQVTQKLICPS